MVVHAGGQALVAIGAEGARRHRDDGRRVELGHRADQARRLQAVHLGHLHVHQHQVIGASAHHVDRDAAVVGHLHLQAHQPQQLGGQLLVDEVVVGDQHARVAMALHERLLHAAACRQPFVRRRRSLRLRARRLQPGGEPEHAAAAGFALHADGAAHQLRQLARDRQAQSGAAEASRGRTVGLLERREQALLRLGRYAHARISHREADRPFGAASGQQVATQGDAAARRELDGIVQQVHQDLRQPQRVAAQRLRQVAAIHRQRQALAARAVGDQRRGAGQQRVDREIHRRQHQLAGIDLRQVEDVVDDVEQVHRRIAHLGEAVGRDRVVRVAQHQVRQPDDHVHRRADLVAHVGEESRLRLRGILGHVARRDEFLVEGLQVGLGALGRRDVGGEHEEAAHLAALHVGDVVHLPDAVAPVGADLLALELLRRAGQRRVREPEPFGRAVRAEDLHRRLAQHLVERLAEPFAIDAVGEAAAQLVVPVGDAAGQVVGDAARERLGLDQLGVEFLQAAFAAPHLGDVGGDEEVAADVAIDHVRQAVDPEVADAAADAAHLGRRSHRFAAQHFRDHLLGGLQHRRVHRVAGVATEHLLARLAEPVQPRAVGKLQAAVAVDIGQQRGLVVGHRLGEVLAGDARGHGGLEFARALVHQFLEPVTVAFELGGGPLAFPDAAQHAQHRGRVLVRGAIGHEFELGDAAVLAQELHLVRTHRLHARPHPAAETFAPQREQAGGDHALERQPDEVVALVAQLFQQQAIGVDELEILGDEHAVGQCIHQGPVGALADAQRLLHATRFRHVGHRHQGARDSTGGRVAQRLAVDVQPRDPGRRGAHAQQRMAHRPARGQHHGNGNRLDGHHVAGFVDRLPVVEPVVAHLLERRTQQPLRGQVDALQARIAVEDHHALAERFDHRPVALLAAAQCRHRGALARDVVHHAQLGRFAAPRSQRGRHRHVPRAAVRQQEVVLVVHLVGAARNQGLECLRRTVLFLLEEQCRRIDSDEPCRLPAQHPRRACVDVHDAAMLQDDDPGSCILDRVSKRWSPGRAAFCFAHLLDTPEPPDPGSDSRAEPCPGQHPGEFTPMAPACQAISASSSAHHATRPGATCRVGNRAFRPRDAAGTR